MLGFPDSSLVKNLPGKQETQVWSLEKEIATHSNILAWKIPWTEGFIYISTKIYFNHYLLWIPNQNRNEIALHKYSADEKEIEKPKNYEKKTNASKKTEQLKFSYILGGMQNENSTGENCWKAFYKVKHIFYHMIQWHHF